MLRTLRAGIERGEWATEGRKNLLGRPVDVRPVEARGQLPEPYRSELRDSIVDYAIYSYNTPIAWRRVDGVWRIPSVTYSLTTTGHQLLVRNLLRDMAQTCEHCHGRVEAFRGFWWTGDDFMCPDGETQHRAPVIGLSGPMIS